MFNAVPGRVGVEHMYGVRKGPAQSSLVLGAASIGAGTTLLILVFPFVRFAYRAPGLHIALETAAAAIGFLATYLVLGRLRARGQLRDLALACAFGLFASTNLVFSVIPAVLGSGRIETFSTWSSLIARILATVAYAFAAFCPERQLRSSKHAAVRVSVVVTTVLITIAAFVIVFMPSLPAGIQVVLAPEASARPHIEGHPLIHSAQLVTMLLFGSAAIGFLRRARSDEFMRWLAGASTLAAFSRLNYLLFPSLYSQYVYTGDFLRLGFYLLLMTGAFREIRSYWSQLATLEERRRVARDLHDGLAQELAFIASSTKRLGLRGTDNTMVKAVASAAERALDESRRAIAALTNPDTPPFEVALAEMTEEVAGRTGVRVTLQLTSGIELPAGTREELLRIAREAVNNAARHGDPKTITVHLSNGKQLNLRIADDGKGFDLGRTSAATTGFGLVSMRERAEALGGHLHIESHPGMGTEVNLMLSQPAGTGRPDPP